MQFPALGQRVVLLGTVTGVFCIESTDPSQQAFNVQLLDGQAVHTNIRNICAAPETEAEQETPAEGEHVPSAVGVLAPKPEPAVPAAQEPEPTAPETEAVTASVPTASDAAAVPTV